MITSRGIFVSVVMCLALMQAGCAPTVADLRADNEARKPGLREQLLNSIGAYGFRREIRGAHDGNREIDTILVAIPLDSLKRQYINLHHMLFNMARICARPEYSGVSIEIELHAADESDRVYMRSVVEPIVVEARNVKVVSQPALASGIVVVLSPDSVKSAAGSGVVGN